MNCVLYCAKYIADIDQCCEMAASGTERTCDSINLPRTSARAALERRTIQIPDVLADPEYSYGAIIQLAKAMAVDHAGQNIRVNALSPGAVETRRLLLRYGDMATARRAAGPKHLLNRLGEPEEIAQAALFLASDAASFMTGADMLVDGGYTTI
jgi:hypothetical protein